MNHLDSGRDLLCWLWLEESLEVPSGFGDRAVGEVSTYAKNLFDARDVLFKKFANVAKNRHAYSVPSGSLSYFLRGGGCPCNICAISA
jgi:hypothetical protein